jgi:hypothetical protein
VPDINLVAIATSQLYEGEASACDIGAFPQKYLTQGDSWFSIDNIPPWRATNLLQNLIFSWPSVATKCSRPGVELPLLTASRDTGPRPSNVQPG